MSKVRCSWRFVSIPLVLVVLVASWLGGCGSSKPALTVVLPGDINTLDPHASELIVVGVYRNQVFDSLTLKNPKTLEMEPRLATAWEWENPTTLAVTLRENVVFHDGKKLTGQDVKFSLERYRDKAAYGGRIIALDRVEVVSDTKVKLILKQHHAGIMDALGQAHIVQAGHDDDWYKKNAIGTGPFKLAEWQPGNLVRLEKNPNYWRPGEPKSDVLVFKVMPQLESRIAALQAGDVDILFDVDLREIDRLKKDSNVKVEITDQGDFLYSIYVNTRRPALRDPRVRRAIAHALDRQAFIQQFQGSLAIPTNSALAPSHWAYDRSLDGKLSFDLEKAKQLLAQAGFPGGKGLKLTLVFPAGYADLKAGSEVLHSGLTRLGIEAELREMELGAWYNAVAKEFNYDLGWDIRRNALDDPAVQYGTTGGFQPGPKNRTGLDWDTLPELTQALRQGESTMERKVRIELYHKVEQTLAEQPYIIPVAVKPMSYAYRKNISGILPQPASHYQEFRQVTKS